MKVLYIGSERSDAQAVAAALRSIDEKVTILWASQLEHASGWLDENRDAVALVMEAPIDGASCLSAQKHLRRMALPPAVIFVVPEGIAPTLDSMHPGADYVRRNQTLSRDLPIAVTRGIERAARADLEHKLTQATAALHDAEQRHQAALAASAEQLAAAQAQFEIGMARATATWEMVDEQLRTAALEVERARQQQQAAAAEVDRLSRQLADAEKTIETTKTRAAKERRAAEKQAEQQQRELQSQITHEIDRRRNVEQLLADAVSAQEDAEKHYASTISDAEKRHASTISDTEKRHASAMLDAEKHHASAISDAETRHASAMSDAEQRLASAMSNAEQRLASAMSDAAAQSRELEASLRQAREEAASTSSAVDRLTAQGLSLQSRLDEVSGNHHDLERQLAATQAAFDDAAVRATRDRLALSRKAAEREAELDGQIRQERTARAALEYAIAAAEAALRDAQTQHDAALAAASAQLTDRENSRDALERRLADATQQAVERERDLDERLQQERTTRAALEKTIADVEAAIDEAQRQNQQLTADLQATRDALERQLADVTREAAERQTELNKQLEHEQTRRAALEQTIADVEAAIDEAQQQYQSAVTEIEQLTDRATDLVTQLSDVQAAHSALETRLADANTVIHDTEIRRTALEEQIRQERAIRDELDRVLVETRSAAIQREAQFESQLAQEQLEHEKRATEIQQSLASLREESEQLQQSLAASVERLEASRAESHRLFDQAGVAMFRCTRDGALTDVNRACATLIGRRTLGDVDGIEFAPAVFEDPNVLSWLIERCLSTRTKESVETTWRRHDGSRLFVRLSARSSSPDVIEIVAEDLTRVRVLEERLGRANRMEAVGRLALEVAVTCGALLTSIHQKGENWLATIGNAASRDEGQRLFDDVGRAAGFLRDLAACGDEQARTSTLVDLNTLIRDLEPVLKRVAGGDVEVQLRDTSSPLNVDVGTERVERLLVNLASYGRGRMPAGGRLRIELGTSVVDRRFAAKHPNVRLGLHALITVTETGRPTSSEEERAKAAGKPGVDFGTLQELVSECGGHLWMKVQPPGDMVAKIRLPLLSAQEQAAPRAAIRSNRERAANRWFQS